MVNFFYLKFIVILQLAYIAPPVQQKVMTEPLPTNVTTSAQAYSMNTGGSATETMKDYLSVKTDVSNMQRKVNESQQAFIHDLGH